MTARRGYSGSYHAAKQIRKVDPKASLNNIANTYRLIGD